MSAFDDPSVAQAAAAAAEPNPFAADQNAYTTSFWQTNDNVNNDAASGVGVAYNNISDANYGNDNAYGNPYENHAYASSGAMNNASANVANTNNTNKTNNNSNNYDNNNSNNINNANGASSKNIASNDNIYSTYSTYSTSGVSGVSGSSKLNHNDLDKREEVLRMKEKELEERQARLNGLEDEIEGSNFRQDNWPSACYPITFHSISQEIPPFARPHMRKMYSLVLLTFLCLLWNLCAELALFLTESGEDSKDADILWATVYFFVGVFAAWKLWYRQIYYGLRDRQTTRWWIFFVVFILHIAFACYCAIGLENDTGAAGYVVMFSAFNRNAAAGLCNLVSAILWTILFLASVFLLKRSWGLFRQRGGLEQARAELSAGITREVARQALNNPNQVQNLV